MTLRTFYIFVFMFLTIPSCFSAQTTVIVELKQETPITTAYEYELGRGKPGDSFQVQESRGALLFGFYPMVTGGIRGYISRDAVVMTDELKAFIDAEETRRLKLREALERKIELSSIPQPPGRMLVRYIEERDRDFTSVNGVILETMTWKKENSPYFITAPVYVPSGVILFIDPGVEIYVERSENPAAGIASGQVNGIIISGNVVAVGRPDQAISFRGFGSRPTDRNTWGGINILDTSDPGNIFRWVIIENASTGISCGKGPVVSNCIFRYNYSGMLLNEAAETANVFNNLFISNSTGIEARGAPASAAVYNNVFADNRPNGGIRAWRSAGALIAYNAMYNNAQDYIGWSPFSTDIRVNPMFVDPRNGDYHLNPRSPLIGRGRGGSNIGLYAGRDAVHQPRERTPVTTTSEEEKTTDGEDKESGDEKSDNGTPDDTGKGKSDVKNTPGNK